MQLEWTQRALLQPELPPVEEMSIEELEATISRSDQCQ